MYFTNLATPMGQMPLLEVDGKVVHQSIAILRYLSKRFGLAGSSDWEALLIEIVADTITDFRISKIGFCLNWNYENKIIVYVELSAPWYETDEDLKAKKKAKIEEEIVPFYLEKLEAIAIENNGYFALSKVLHFLFECIYFEL